MEEVIHDYAEKVPVDSMENKHVNYIPHTGVYHPRKPEKISIVFDCSAPYQGVSLNNHLLQGPKLMNNLLGVLCKFHKEEVAFATDVKSMFHQFQVPKEDRDMLRFLWFDDNDPKKPVIEYRMKVDLFGAVSSPGCANFGLGKAADDGEQEFGSDAADFIRNDFYMDDGAVKILEGSKANCGKAGLKLHKIVSNSRDVLKSFPAEEIAKSFHELDLDVDPLSLQRALGIAWCTESDTFQFKFQVQERPLTQRGVLSTISSIYDPSGFLGPVLLKGKVILHEVCHLKLDWDSPMPDSLQAEWRKWLDDI
ncbi:uncharacterized protein [Diadema setosum]|uniref:uncharacterized protein n=1 Tax=Diadema setosum TaxID=31175 RepID=UPI003B3ADBEE